MAERRMFSRAVVDGDRFLDMSPMAQLLYFHLGMQADDDGFVDKPRTIMRMVRCKLEDMNELIENGYIYMFDSGIAAIRHWRVCNLIKKDRYKPTIYIAERALLRIDENNIYEPEPKRNPNGTPV